LINKIIWFKINWNKITTRWYQFPIPSKW